MRWWPVIVVLASALLPSATGLAALGPVPRPSCVLSSARAAAHPIAPGRTHVPKAARRAGEVVMFPGGGPGSFLNLGAPEVIVIGAVAWALLGPKELFRLSREAGEFLGQWQQLGQQAKDTFTSALETELREDEMSAASKPSAASAAAGATAWQQPPPSQPAPPPPPGVDSLPPLSEYAASRDATVAGSTSSALGPQPDDDFSPEEAAALRESLAEEVRMGHPCPAVTLAQNCSAPLTASLPQNAMALSGTVVRCVAQLGDPESNSAAFAEQISGARNEAVLSEYPQELTAFDEISDSELATPLGAQGVSEDLIETQIAQAENELATLRAEKEVG